MYLNLCTCQGCDYISICVFAKVVTLFVFVYLPNFICIRIYVLVKVVTDKMREDDEASAVEGDWKFAAMVGII